MNTFSNLQLIEPILRAVDQENYTTPTPIQMQAIPHLINGSDLLGCAQTGTGKTAAFALPILQRLFLNPRKTDSRSTRTLILTPTRELAAQIGESFRAYGRHLNLTHTVIYGGVGQNPQTKALIHGVDIVIATPGRLLDLMQQSYLKLNQIEVFVLDEADRMLDMGFIQDIRKIIATLPKQRQTLMFSATMPPDIARLAESILNNPVKVEVTPVASTVERIEQRVMFVDRSQKSALLGEALKDPAMDRTLVFTRTKHGANRLVEHLGKIKVRAEAIHGNKSQSARERALHNFRNGHTRVLVATDVASRGIDIDGITHVINYDIPNDPESYVHRIGRTARAGASGTAISFCSGEERSFLRDIEKLIRYQVPVVNDHPFVSGSASSNHGHATSARLTDRLQPRRDNGFRQPRSDRNRRSA